MRQRRTLAIVIALVACAVCFCGTTTLLVFLNPTNQRVYQNILADLNEGPARDTPTLAIVRSGEARRDLGQQPVDFGSVDQARELLSLIEEESNRADYQIVYQTEDDAVVFGCNFEEDVIVRIHQRPDGSGSQEAWQGYIMERLTSAASGGSLNDTPEGEIFGTFESF